MESLLRDLRYASRALRRAPGFALSVVFALAIGTGVGVSLLSLLRAGYLRALPYTDQGPGGRIAGDWLSGGSAEARTVAEIQDAGIEALLEILLAVTILAFAIAGTNLATLLLSRATARRQELAMRATLGASRRRIARQLLTEGGLLCVLGLGAGLLFGIGATLVLRASWPTDTPPWDRLGVDISVLAAVIGVLSSATLLFALAPAAAALRKNLHASLTATGRVTAGRGEAGVRNALVVAQLAASLVLLTGAGLLLRSSLPQTGEADGAFDAGHTLTMQLDLSDPRYADDRERMGFYTEVLDRIESLPGVRAESIASTGAWVGLGTEDRVRTICPECSIGGMILVVIDRPARHHLVSPGFFDTLGVSVLRGRGFSRSEAAIAPKEAVSEVVINEAFAYRLFPNGDPLGKQVRVGGRQGEWYTVVGVVENIGPRGIGTGATPAPALYLSVLQHPPRHAGLAVRVATEPMDFLPAVERAIVGADAGQAPADVATMEERLARFAAPLVWFGGTFGVLAALAILLAGVGLYGVMSYNVARRTREVGIRVALGAGAGRVLRLIMGQGARLTWLGTIFGLWGALSLARLLQVLFHGVRPLDPAVYGSVVLLLAAATLLASYRPARHATRVDPVVALRAE